MCNSRPRHGLTLLELVCLIGLFTSLIALAIPAIQAARESARREACSNNLKQLGFACHAYHSAQEQFPPSSGVTRNADGTITAVDGWSWLVLLLPYVNESLGSEKLLYDSLDIAQGRPLMEPLAGQGTPHADALATSLPQFRCPSFRVSYDLDMTDDVAAITNYKGMGATHRESLSVASPHPLTPKYDLPRPGSKVPAPHPDGMFFPGTGVRIQDVRDGISNTLLAAESAEPRCARWTVGAEAAVVGLPPIVEFEFWDGGGRAKKEYVVTNCMTVKGLRNVTEDGAGADPCYWTYRTYLDWDCEANPYDGLDGTKGGKFGPSSHHPGVTNHLVADGSVRAFRRDLSVIVYMKLITRSLGDN